MSTFYTRQGDDGTTTWLGKGRLSKYDLRFEALGTMDEASAFLGTARACVKTEQIKELIPQIQRDLYSIMSEVAADPENAERFRFIGVERVTWLENQTETIIQSVGLPGEFIMPGDTVGGAALDVARTIVRRAERRLAELHHSGGINNPVLMSYTNRLSSLIFVMELLENKTEGFEPPSLARKKHGE